jgi:hypothetical protein
MLRTGRTSFLGRRAAWCRVRMEVILRGQGIKDKMRDAEG